MYIHTFIYTESERAFTNQFGLPRCTKATNQRAPVAKFHFSNFQNREALQEIKKGRRWRLPAPPRRTGENAHLHPHQQWKQRPTAFTTESSIAQVTARLLDNLSPRPNAAWVFFFTELR